MAGILNSKERVIDTIITQEGLKQASSGRLKAEYVSFSDSQTFYATDTLVSGGLDATYRMILEPTNFFQDAITLENDDSGKLNALFVSGSTQVNVVQGNILSGSIALSGSAFASMSETLLSQSINNFKNLYILKSPNFFSGPQNFELGQRSTNYTITDSRPISKNEVQEANLDNLESLFYDKRLSHLSNFKFMPPVQISEESNGQPVPIGDYQNLNQEGMFTFDDAKAEIDKYEKTGFSTTVRFLETSQQNNLFGQFFELSEGKTLKKLDVIDFGEFQTDDGIKHIFYVGKVFMQSTGTNTFVNLFTLVFE